MPNIRPSTDLRNKYNEISEFCHEFNEPVFVTKHGQGDLAVMSMETYHRLTAREELNKLIDEGLADVREGRVMSWEEFEKNLDLM